MTSTEPAGAACHPKDRSGAKEVRSTLTRREQRLLLCLTYPHEFPKTPTIVYLYNFSFVLVSQARAVALAPRSLKLAQCYRAGDLTPVWCRMPSRVDEHYAASAPAACPDCGGAVEVTRVASQYQEELPVVRPVVRRFDVEVGHCSQCQRRVQGRHVLQTSDALGAAGVQLGPGVVALVVELHTEMGVPLAKVAHLLRTTFGLQVTPGGLAHVLHRVARAAAPAYSELCEQVRNASVVTPDETGWRVGGERHWLWVFTTPDTTVYAICPGRGFDDAATVLGPATPACSCATGGRRIAATTDCTRRV